MSRWLIVLLLVSANAYASPPDEVERMLALSDPRPEDVAQVLAYAKDTKEKFPHYHVRSYIVYICANKGWKCWEVTP